MLYSSHRSDKADAQTCTCCGSEIRPLDGPHRLLSISDRSAMHQRAYQCMNCGQMTCLACSKNGCHCTCHTNAWVAKPVLTAQAV